MPTFVKLLSASLLFASQIWLWAWTIKFKPDPTSLKREGLPFWQWTVVAMIYCGPLALGTLILLTIR